MKIDHSLLGKGRLLETVDLDAVYRKEFANKMDSATYYDMAAMDISGFKYTYLRWLLREYLKGNISMNSTIAVRLVLNDFQKIRNNIGKSPVARENPNDVTSKLIILRNSQAKVDSRILDINTYSFPQLKEFVKNNESYITSNTEKIESIKSNETVILENDKDITVVIPLTMSASIQWGKNTQWCTAAVNGGNAFYSYAIDSIIIIVIYNKYDEKYQISMRVENNIISFDEIRDENDNDPDEDVQENVFNVIRKCMGGDEGIKEFYKRYMLDFDKRMTAFYKTKLEENMEGNYIRVRYINDEVNLIEFYDKFNITDVNDDKNVKEIWGKKYSIKDNKIVLLNEKNEPISKAYTLGKIPKFIHPKHLIVLDRKELDDELNRVCAFYLRISYRLPEDYVIDLNYIDVSNIIDMQSLFKGWHNIKLPIDISQWNVSNVRYMHSMFSGFDAFDSDISRWDVSGVTDMISMFEHCTNFNSDLSRWDVSNVKYMDYMFWKCTNFNSDLSRWDVSKVKTMTYMFYDCRKLNSDLSHWDVSNVNSMTGMFIESGIIDPQWYEE